MTYDYSCANWDGLCEHLRDILQEDIFKLSASVAASEFCEWVQVVIDVYNLIESIRSSFAHLHGFQLLVLCCHSLQKSFFCFYQKDKLSESKVKFRQASNCCKSVLEAAKLAYTNKTKESITSQKLGSQDFRGIANSVIKKGKSGIPCQFNGPEVFAPASDKAKLFAENLSKNSDLDHSGITLPFFPSSLNVLSYQLNSSISV